MHARHSISDHSNVSIVLPDDSTQFGMDFSFCYDLWYDELHIPLDFSQIFAEYSTTFAQVKVIDQCITKRTAS